jgi:uncharacterized protein
VILIDANILVYAYIKEAPQHHRARAWLDQQLSGVAQVGFPWLSLLAFLRITTNPRVSTQPVPIAEVWTQVTEWLACPQAWVPQPGERHPTIFGALLVNARIYGNLVMDAHLAALAIEHGLTMCSADSDFAKFPGLRWFNPLTQAE